MSSYIGCVFAKLSHSWKRINTLKSFVLYVILAVLGFLESMLWLGLDRKVNYYNVTCSTR